MSGTAAPSLRDHVVPVAAGAHVVGAAWLKETAALALGDGGVLLVADGETRRVEAHAEAGILVTACDGRRLVTGGDDGRVVATDAKGDSVEMAAAKGLSLIHI